MSDTQEVKAGLVLHKPEKIRVDCGVFVFPKGIAQFCEDAKIDALYIDNEDSTLAGCRLSANDFIYLPEGSGNSAVSLIPIRSNNTND